jgi:RNA polymerase sigma factor (sigma-70 family)
LRNQRGSIRTEAFNMRSHTCAHLISASLEALASRAQEGNRDALNTLLGRIQEKIYKIAVKMLASPDDALDATQEILLRIATRLGSFRGESAFTTWMYRLAINYLISARKEKIEERAIREGFSHELLDRADPEQAADPLHRGLLLDEIKMASAIGMLLCLNCPYRLAYLLGEILDLDCEQAALILDIPAATFRKQLSRARADMLRFLRNHCGPVEERDVHQRHRPMRALRDGGANHSMCSQDLQCAARFRRVLEHVRVPEESQHVVALFPCHQLRVTLR